MPHRPLVIRDDGLIGEALSSVELWCPGGVGAPSFFMSGLPTGYMYSGSGSFGSVSVIPNTDVAGLGTAATQNTGTSGASVARTDGANTWSAAQTIASDTLAQLKVQRVTAGNVRVDIVRPSLSTEVAQIAFLTGATFDYQVGLIANTRLSMRSIAAGAGLAVDSSGVSYADNGLQVTGPLSATGNATLGTGTGDTFGVRMHGTGGTQFVAAGNVAGVPTLSGYTSGFAAPTTLQLQNHGGELSIGGDVAVGGNISIAMNGADPFNYGRLDGFNNILYVVARSDPGAAVGTQIRLRTATAGAVETDQAVVDSVGNFGIGTMSPGEKLAVAGNISATKAFLVDDVYQITGVTTASQTRTVDLANGEVQTISANQAFTLNVTGPAGKSGLIRLYVYNPSAFFTLTYGTGWWIGGTSGVTAGHTRLYHIEWNGTAGAAVVINGASGDHRPT